MVDDSHPLNWKIGLVGYGEVGRILAEDLRKRGVSVCAYDLKLDDSKAAPLLTHARQFGVELMSAHKTLARECDLIISAVTANQTLAAAAACAPHQNHAYYLDLNSASPGIKCQAAERLARYDGCYVEGAIMTSMPPYRIGVPLLLGGPRATALATPLTYLGFNPKIGDEQLGIVSATKMCRSVVIKGLEAILIESLTSARYFGVEETVLISLAETFPGIDWERQASYMFSRVIAHGERRAEEMREVAETVREAGLEPCSAAGTAQRQSWMAKLTDNGCFGEPKSAGFSGSPDWRTEADRILAHLPRPSQEEH